MENLFQQLCKSHTLLNAWKIIKQKNSIGGIDGIAIKDVDQEIGILITEIQKELAEKTWTPQPYLTISIPKKNNEKRKLGLLCIKDKIVQQAIKLIIEPRFENLFLPNSYGYRPNKGHTKAIKFAKHCCFNKKYPIVLRLDIDNYFDNINHEILFNRLKSIISDDEILRLIKLSVQMGCVNKNLHWSEIIKGVAQGSILSPILANFYLHSFDQFVLSHTDKYVRYADDFIICCENIEKAKLLLDKGTLFLSQRLKLTLNTPNISEIKNGFEFLGIILTDNSISISSEKHQILISRIKELTWSDSKFSDSGQKHLQGIHNYYGILLPQNILLDFDAELIAHLKHLISSNIQNIPNKSTLSSALKDIDFFADENVLNKSKIRADLIAFYLTTRSSLQQKHDNEKNKKIVRIRKLEYRKKENEATELIINTFGTNIGVNNKGISLKIFGKAKSQMPPTSNLSHITILCKGVSISSNAVDYCMRNKIPIDFFSSSGHHYGSILNNLYLSYSLWQKQSELSIEKRAILAQKIILGKLKNQYNLIKYFHKYHKLTDRVLCEKYDLLAPKISNIIKQVQNYKISASTTDDYRAKLIGLEAAGASLYWDYIKILVSDDNVSFESRERKGATDLFNCLLNYGYAIIYARVWQSLLWRKLNPMDSVVHVPQDGKPTFVYDVIELFRSQAVDRVVISLIQKKESLEIKNNLLTDKTKNLLVQNILERLNRYELYRGKECRLSDIINLQTKEIAEFISENKNYKPYIAKW